MNMYNQFMLQQYLNQQSQFGPANQQKMSTTATGMSNNQNHQTGATGNGNFYPTQQNQIYQQMQQA